MDFEHNTQRTALSADEIARQHTEQAIQTLVDILHVADFDSTRVAAARELLDRGHGKPVQAIIQIPQKKAKRYQLASLTEAELIERIERAPLPSMFAQLEHQVAERVDTVDPVDPVEPTMDPLLE